MPFSGTIFLVLLTSVVNVSSRAVNISNTWMLPEEGFPVFYRYFRDRISWYEADAVCQFHHAYLVTADNISQYDAIRAYLKEMDITDSVWIGLSKTSEKPNFTWTDFQPLSGDGHWQDVISPANKDPMCVAMDPAKDFLWRPMSCGGPEVSSFICEMPIPSWALGPKGCLLTELPSLTVLYIPEQSSLELTSDCGLDGTKRIACKGNADRREIMKHLACTVLGEDFEDKAATKSPVGTTTNSDEYLTNSKTTKSSIWTSNTIDIDYGVPTRHRRETEDTLSPVFTKSTIDLGLNDRKTTTIDISTGTNYDTEGTTNSLEDSSTTDSTVVSQKYLEITNLETSTNGNLDISSVNVESSTFTIEIEAKMTVEDVTDEYPGAVNQGHLFSIIRNGTMFDIIDLNETDHDTKLTEDTTITHQEHINFKPPKKLTQKNDKIGNNMNEEKQKVISKTEIYKNTDPKKQNLNPAKTFFQKKAENTKGAQITSTEGELMIENQNLDVNKEFPLFPIIKDLSLFLNRTSRKQPPTPKSVFNDVNSLPVQDISNSVEDKTPDMQFENLPIKFNISRNLGEILTQETVIAAHIIDIDPKIDILNNNVSSHTNESEIIEFVAPPEITNKTFDDDLLKNQFSSRTALEEKNKLNQTAPGKSNDNTDETLEKDPTNPETQPKPNRQRQLTRPQRKTFYPYFFSRVLG